LIFQLQIVRGSFPASSIEEKLRAQIQHPFVVLQAERPILEPLTFGSQLRKNGLEQLLKIFTILRLRIFRVRASFLHFTAPLEGRKLSVDV
jgi:hypothetical protein